MYSFNFYEQCYDDLNSDTFADRLKNARKKKGLSQMDLSLQLNINRNTVANYELGLVHPTKSTLLKLGKLLDLNYLCCNGYARLLISNFSEKLKLWRKSKNLCCSKAATFFNVSKDTYYRWEKNIYTINKNHYEHNKLLIDFILEYYICDNTYL